MIITVLLSNIIREAKSHGVPEYNTSFIVMFYKIAKYGGVYFSVKSLAEIFKFAEKNNSDTDAALRDIHNFIEERFLKLTVKNFW